MGIDDFLAYDYAEQQDLVTTLSYDELWDLRDSLPSRMNIDEELAYDLINEQINYLEEEEEISHSRYDVTEDE